MIDSAKTETLIIHGRIVGRVDYSRPTKTRDIRTATMRYVERSQTKTKRLVFIGSCAERVRDLPSDCPFFMTVQRYHATGMIVEIDTLTIPGGEGSTLASLG